MSANVIFCPPPDAKTKKSDSYVESKGVLGVKHDLPLNIAIAHMRRLDGSLPVQASTGRKPLDLLAGFGQKRYFTC